MADNSIKLNTAARLGFELQRVADLGAQFRHHLAQVVSVMNAMDDGASHTSIEVPFGLPAGSGAATVYLLNNAKTALDSATAANQLIDWLCGVTG